MLPTLLLTTCIPLMLPESQGKFIPSDMLRHIAPPREQILKELEETKRKLEETNKERIAQRDKRIQELEQSISDLERQQMAEKDPQTKTRLTQNLELAKGLLKDLKEEDARIQKLVEELTEKKKRDK